MKTNPPGFSLEDVMIILGVQSRTGELVVESGNNIGAILVHKGKILHVHSPYSRAIGDLLVEAELITEADLMETLSYQKKNPSLPLGSLLLKQGKITFEVIEMMVQEQIRQAMKEFQTWQDMSFSFAPKSIQPYDRIHLPILEFILPETVRSALDFFSGQTQKPGPLSKV